MIYACKKSKKTFTRQNHLKQKKYLEINYYFIREAYLWHLKLIAVALRKIISLSQESDATCNKAFLLEVTNFFRSIMLYDLWPSNSLNMLVAFFFQLFHSKNGNRLDLHVSKAVIINHEMVIRKKCWSHSSTW